MVCSNPSMTDDWVLFDEWREGKRSSGEELLARYFDVLARFFLSRVGNSEDVADLVSETMLQCSRSSGRQQAGATFRAYLISIGINVLRRFYRKRSKRTREVGDFADVYFERLGDERSMTSLVALEQQGKLLVRAIRTLSLEQQLVLELNLIEDFKGPEIAELLGVPVPTVYTRLRRGTEKLKAAVHELATSSELATSTMTGLHTWAKRIREEISG